MSTLTMMERTANGWRCPRCGDTREDDLLAVRVVECNCAGMDAFREAIAKQCAAESRRAADEVAANPLVKWMGGGK